MAPTASTPGDILLTNDSYIMGSHLNHMIFTVPIFWKGEIVAFSASMAHWQDVGGVLGGATRDIYSRGPATPHRQDFQRGPAGPRAYRHHPLQCALPRLGHG